MRRLCSSLIFLLLATAVQAGDEVIVTDPNDPEMIAAVTIAQNHLSDFLADYAKHKGDATDYGVKVSFPIKGSETDSEVIWVTFFDQIDVDNFVGRLSNEPNFMSGFHLDSEVTFTQDMIQDWYIYENGKVYGYFTVRILLPQLDETTAEQVRQSMHDNPLPERFQ